MNAKVVIGKVTFLTVSSVRIEETITELGNKATIVLPRNFKKLNEQPVLNFINVGDQVSISLGYDGNIAEEFTGYVSRINAEMPLVIECENWYLFKQNTLIQSAKEQTLLQFLKFIFKDFPEYKFDAPDAKIKLQLAGSSTYEALRRVQQDYGLYCRIVDKTIVVGFSYDWHNQEARYKYYAQGNVRKSSLEWKTTHDFKLRIQAYYMEGGKKKAVYYGDPEKGAKTRPTNKTAVSKEDALKQAKSIFEKNVFTGFTGSITGFGIPRTHAGDTLDLTDDNQPERNGAYLISKVTIDYNENGYSRTNELAHKTAT